MRLELSVEAALSACLLYQLGREFAPWAAQRRHVGAFALGGAALATAISAAAYQPGAEPRWSALEPVCGLVLVLGTLLAVLRVRDRELACPAEVLRGPDAQVSRVCPAPAALALAGFFFGLGLALQWRLQAALTPGFGVLLIEARWKRGAWPSRRSLWVTLSSPFSFALCGVAIGDFLFRRAGHEIGASAAALSPGLGPDSASAGMLSGLWRLFLELGSDWTWMGFVALGLGWALLFRKKPWMAAGLFSLILGPALCSAAAAPALSMLSLIQVFLGLGLAGFMAVPPLRRWLGPVFLAAALATAWRLRP